MAIASDRIQAAIAAIVRVEAVASIAIDETYHKIAPNPDKCLFFRQSSLSNYRHQE
jgi:hypothetical protein